MLVVLLFKIHWILRYGMYNYSFIFTNKKIIIAWFPWNVYVIHGLLALTERDSISISNTGQMMIKWFVLFFSFPAWRRFSLSCGKRIVRCQRCTLFITDVCQCPFGLVSNSLQASIQQPEWLRVHFFHFDLFFSSDILFVSSHTGGHSTFFGLLNTFVHIVMYSYYLFSALGPQFQKYLWWKKYLTALQMVSDFELCIYY